VFLIGGFGLKGRCLDGQFNARAYTDLCYNDIQPLYGLRLFADRDGDGAVERVFPYIHASRNVERNELRDGAIEYPVLTGLFMYATGLLADDGDSYLRISALFLAPFALIAAFLLARIGGWRALMFAAGPALVFYAFHNWDLLVVAATVAGIYAWSRGSPVWAGVLFGVGAAFKMYPIFFLAPLFLERWVAKDRRGAVAGAGIGAGTFALINLPFVLANFEGWWATYGFHSARLPNFDSMWCPLRRMCLEAPYWDPKALNLLTLALTGAFFLAIVAVGLVRARREGVYPFVQTCGALLATFLLFNKVHSPQYTLWLLPFFVLIGSAGWAMVGWVLYAVADALVYWGVFHWFADFNSGPFPRSELVMLTGIWMRAGLLLVLVVAFMMSRSADPRPPEPAGVREPRAPEPVTGEALTEPELVGT
jgi:uncharacterized membrane protein